MNNDERRLRIYKTGTAELYNQFELKAQSVFPKVKLSGWQDDNSEKQFFMIFQIQAVQYIENYHNLRNLLILTYSSQINSRRMNMSARNIFRVIPKGRKWQVRKNGSILSSHAKRKSAVEKAVQMAEDVISSQVIVYRPDGSLQKGFVN